MNESEICKHLDFAFEEFLQKIEIPQLRDAVKEKAYFAGGCIYCLRNSRPVKDYDIFMTDDTLFDDLKGVEIWSFVSDYAFTCGKFQVITKYFGDPERCVGQFDFKHNMHYYIPGTSKIKCAYVEEFFDEEPEFEDFEYLNTDELIFNENRARDIEGVYLRVEKFVNRGMRISKETKKKIKKRTTKKAIKTYKKSRRGSGHSYYQ